MPTVTLRYRLPDEQSEYDAARLGGEALSTLWQIDQHCRKRIKYCEITTDEVHALEYVRAMIPAELLETGTD
jgi:hypothetical protein